MPWIEAEFQRHLKVLSANDLWWHLSSKDTPEVQCTAKVMDDELEQYVVQKLADRQAEQLRREQAELAKQLRAARPTIQRQFAALRGSTDPPDDQLRASVNLANHLARIGGRRDAWYLLAGELLRLKPKASEAVRLDATLRLAELMVEDEVPESALRHLQEIGPYFAKLTPGDSARLKYLRLWARVLREQCAHREAITAFKEIAQTTPIASEKQDAIAEIVEIHMLQGDFSDIDLSGSGQC